ncbi:MAG: hypothetical protein ACKVOR_02300 [Flavobacteriales bacterium]
MALTRVLIAVKTYPTLSTKYDELVCTAGFLEDGRWIRIYPIQFRKRSYSEQYSKYEWIEVDLVKNEKDFRPESYRPVSHDTPIEIIGEIKADGEDWHERRKIVLQKVYTSMSQLIEEAKEKSITTSLAVFKPTKILDFLAEPEEEREWKKKRQESMKQYNLFEESKGNPTEVVRKLPYKFSYVFEDDEGKKRKLMNEDWEVGALYWNCLMRHEGDEAKTVEDVRKKYFDDFSKTKDLHFFLGTTLKFHAMKAPNPFVIIGTFHPKHVQQIRLF